MAAGAAADFSFYDTLRQHDSADIRTAAAFARTFTDFAQRALAAIAAGQGYEPEYPALLGLPALKAWLDGGSEGLEQRFIVAVPDNWDSSSRRLLPALAQWLATGYDASEPLSGSVQVWLENTRGGPIPLYGALPRPFPPPSPFIWSELPPVEGWLREHSHRPIAIIAHYDLHGVSMLALTQRYLRGLGFTQVDAALSFEWTGDISKLWKRAVPRTLQHPDEYAAVVMVDCPVHSRTPEYTLKALSRVDTGRGQRLIIVDHHADTFTMAPELLQPGVTLAMTDILGCGLTGKWDGHERELMLLGALGDKQPEVFLAYPQERHGPLHEAVDEYSRRALHYSPTPPELKDSDTYPLQPLWDALADGREPLAELASEMLGPLAPPVEPPLPQYEVVGKVAIVTERLTAMGRAWYGLLERVMQDAGVPYAIATRLLNGRNANFLLLTRWQDLDVPPVRMFIPEEYLPRCLGHSTAVWADMGKEYAPQFIRELLKNINAYWNSDTDPTAAIEAIQSAILTQAPVNIEERNAQRTSMLGKPTDEVDYD